LAWCLQARKLESELDVKLASFRRVGTPKGGQGDGSEAEIERLLQQLNDVNKHMQSWVSNAGSDVLSHTLARHRNILHELSQVCNNFSTPPSLNNSANFFHKKNALVHAGLAVFYNLALFVRSLQGYV
jgi:hypothetical protein